MARTKKIERRPTPDNEFAGLKTVELLLHSNEEGAAAELYRRRFNKFVKAQSEQA